MDGIQPYAGGPRPLVAAVHPAGPAPSSVKSPADYVRAVRRRIWLVLAVAIPLATAGTLVVLRLPAIYMVTARIEIKAPKVDPNVARILSDGDQARGEMPDEKFIPNTLAMITDEGFADEVLRDPAFGLAPASLEGDPAAELVAKIKHRQFPLSNLYDVTYEGKDPDRITQTLNFLLDKFRIRTDKESLDVVENARGKAASLDRQLNVELEKLKADLTDHVKRTNSLAPGGRSLTEAKYDMLSRRLFFEQEKASTLQQQAQIATLQPVARPQVDSRRLEKREKLLESKKAFTLRLAKAQRASRDAGDPAIKMARRELEEIDATLAAMDGPEVEPEGTSPVEVYRGIIDAQADEIRSTEGQLDDAITEMRNAMPNFHKYTTLLGEREDKTKQLSDLRKKLSAFEMYSAAQKGPVKIWTFATQPTIPKSPNRPLLIALCIFLGLGLGVSIVCFLEHIDHSVKVPEHLTMGLALPLFGVVPRMIRNARNHRGGHLWTPGIPDSIEADAYRNLRASLLGATSDDRPIVTLLVTSAKAGEGKSTTALNLAATCARAGERTLLMDVDLRRPSLHDVFPRTEGGTGLVDVLRGDLPWQRTVVQTDLPNLDFLPTGDTRDVPIEVLGSLELRQLLISLSEHHYDRVILDGPAVLGLADCRMLGRIVDGALMVVRSGSQEIRPLQRAKAMLEQSRVHIVGVVFNGLFEDLQNWSSYGPSPTLDPSFDFAAPRGLGVSRAPGSTPSRAPALMASGSVEA